MTNRLKLDLLTDTQYAFYMAETACPPCGEIRAYCDRYHDCVQCWIDWLKMDTDEDGFAI